MIWNMSEDDFDSVINVHLKGHWAMSHHAIKYMRREGYGRIVNFSSDAFKGSVGQCNYAAAKAGIIGLTRSIAKETAKFGITCNAMCPAADTRMMMNDAVIANQKRKLEAGLLTPGAVRPLLRRPRARAHRADGRLPVHRRRRHINGHVFHVEKGRINSYFYGEDFKTLSNDGSLFTVDQLIELIPATVANGLTPVVPPVRMQDAIKSTDVKKEKVG
jgi:3-oxoacyl-[acyl-carrier protein] reductase